MQPNAQKCIANQITLKNRKSKQRSYIIKCCGKKTCFGEGLAHVVNGTVSVDRILDKAKISSISTAKTGAKYSSLAPKPATSAPPPDPAATALNLAEKTTASALAGLCRLSKFLMCDLTHDSKITTHYTFNSFVHLRRDS